LIKWNPQWNETIGRSSTWFTTTFTIAQDVDMYIDNPLFLNVTGLSRGHAYVNGMDIGLYWTIPGLCDYAPPSWGCQQGLDQNACNKPTQILCKLIFIYLSPSF